MKQQTVTLAAGLLLTALAGFTATSTATSKANDHAAERNVIKIAAEKDKTVYVMSSTAGERNKYEFSFEELTNMDNIAAKLDDLPADTKAQILSLLARVQASDSQIIELKDADIVIDGAKTDMFMIKTGNGRDQMHVEIDVTGLGAASDSKVLVKKILSQHKERHRHARGGKHKRDIVAHLEMLLDKNQLSQSQIAAIKTLLENK